MKSYETRLSEALQSEHSTFIENGSGGFVAEKVEYLNHCPACGTTDYKVYCVKDKFVHKECLTCGLVYLDPKLSRESTLAFYNSPVNEIYNEKKFYDQGSSSADDALNLRNYRLLLENTGSDVKGKTLLEIGPGKGTFLAAAARDGFEVHAVELNDKLIENLKTITPHVYTKEILLLDLPGDHFDVIYFRDVMEHIDIPIPFLKEIRRVLKPGGVVMIDTHNIKSLVNSITKEFHTVLFAFEHPVHWSPQSLRFAGNTAGLQYKKTYYNHDYQSLLDILKYFYKPTFTYIYPPRRSEFAKAVSGALIKVLQLRLFQKIDRELAGLVSRILRRGAKMQMIFTK